MRASICKAWRKLFKFHSTHPDVQEEKDLVSRAEEEELSLLELVLSSDLRKVRSESQAC